MTPDRFSPSIRHHPPSIPHILYKKKKKKKNHKKAKYLVEVKEYNLFSSKKVFSNDENIINKTSSLVRLISPSLPLTRVISH
jgi:hypothetical protein